MYTDTIYLRRGIGVGSSKDVRVAKGVIRATVLLRCRLGWHSGSITVGYLGLGTPVVNRRTIDCPAGVVLDSGAIGIRRNCVHIVAEEF